MSNRISLQNFQLEITRRINESSVADTQNNRLAVRVGQHDWLISLSDISEVITLPPVTNVPLTKNWFSGITNIRGRLFTVVDMLAFTDTTQTTPNKADNRLLLIHQRFGVHAALLVNQVLGLRNTSNLTRIHSGNPPYPWLTSDWTDEKEQVWTELDINMLVSNAAFLSAGMA